MRDYVTFEKLVIGKHYEFRYCGKNVKGIFKDPRHVSDDEASLLFEDDDGHPLEPSYDSRPYREL